MLKLFSEANKLLKKEKVTTDHFVFRLHCSYTTAILASLCLITTWTHFTKLPIQCLVKGLEEKPINTYCWIMATSTVTGAYKKPFTHVAHPGIDNQANYEGEEPKSHQYYQWVPFVLFGQVLMFYLPKFLWETLWERNKLKSIVCELNQMELRDRKLKYARINKLVKYLTFHVGRHQSYALYYWLCELLTLFNVTFQLFILNWFFNGDFFTYGPDVLFRLADTDPELRYDHFDYVFPKVTKCTFRKFGPSSTIETHDVMCLLPHNNINEKMLLILWLWFVFLFCACTLNMIYTFLLINFRQMRAFDMWRNFRGEVPSKTRHLICKKLNAGDWFLLTLLGLNIYPGLFKDVLLEFIYYNEGIFEYKEIVAEDADNGMTEVIVADDKVENDNNNLKENVEDSESKEVVDAGDSELGLKKKCKFL